MAAQHTRSPRYCGVIGSRYSVPVPRPMSAMSPSRERAVCRPRLMSKESSSFGSLMSPFQPIVVRGFSKYTRIRISNWPASALACSLSLPAYSRAASGSWIEHGPTITSSRGSSPLMISLACRRTLKTSEDCSGARGSSSIRSAGARTSAMPVMRTSSVRYCMVSSARLRRKGQCSVPADAKRRARPAPTRLRDARRQRDKAAMYTRFDGTTAQRPSSTPWR